VSCADHLSPVARRAASSASNSSRHSPQISIHANTYTNDKDRVYGLTGDDFLYVNDGDTLDSAGGGPTGYDWCYVDAEIEAANTCDRVIVR
jgi:hypothetical protein